MLKVLFKITIIRFSVNEVMEVNYLLVKMDIPG